MYFIPFNQGSEKGEPNEFRRIIVSEEGLDLPPDVYTFVENFCIDEQCDCRKAMINAINESNGKILGTFSYGWEGLDCYTEWFSGDEELAIAFKGPSLELGGIQSEYAETLLEEFKCLIEDKKYRDYLERRYWSFKEGLQRIQGEDACICGSKRHWGDCCLTIQERLGPFERTAQNIEKKIKLGRNELCYCGSGKKYKKCCSDKDEISHDPLQNPENFPIEFCLINDNWEDSGLATIFVIRKQIETERLSFVTFLTDVFCVGLKNVIIGVSVSQNRVMDLINTMPQTFIDIDYEECRGIILGAIDYAKNLGFEPHDEWKDVKGFIEADKTYKTNHKFGKNDKPFYVQGPDDNVEKIIKILEKNHA